MEISTCLLVITSNPEDLLQIRRSFAKEQLLVEGLTTMFDFYVEQYLSQMSENRLFSHILLDLDMGYQPALDIVSLLKRHPLTRHIPLTVYSQYQSACLIRLVEEYGVNTYLVRSYGWPATAKVVKGICRRAEQVASGRCKAAFSSKAAA
ncbi:hypothetical protein [Nibrella viscosa]